MSSQVLLVSRDHDAVSVLGAVVRDLGVACDFCPELDRAVERVAQGITGVVIVDYDVEHSTELLKLVRQNYAATCVAMALVKGLASIQAAYDMGANLVLVKPITAEAARRTLAETLDLVERMVRRSTRFVVPKLAYVSVEGMRDPAIVLDFSEGGLALQALHPIPPKGPLRLHFERTGSRETFDVGCEIVWTDASDRAGLRFTDLEPATQRRLEAWLRANGSAHALNAEASYARAVAAKLASAELLPKPPAPPPPSVAQRVLAAALDSVIVLLAGGVFLLIFWIWTRELPSSPWTLLVAACVAFVFWAIYLYLFLAHPRGTPGMQWAEKELQQGKPPEMFAVVPAPGLAAARSRILQWLEAHRRSREPIRLLGHPPAPAQRAPGAGAETTGGEKDPPSA